MRAALHLELGVIGAREGHDVPCLRVREIEANDFGTLPLHEKGEPFGFTESTHRWEADIERTGLNG